MFIISNVNEFIEQKTSKSGGCLLPGESFIA